MNQEYFRQKPPLHVEYYNIDLCGSNRIDSWSVKYTAWPAQPFLSDKWYMVNLN